MSEKLHQKEQQKAHEKADHSAQHEHIRKHQEKAAEQARQAVSERNMASLRAEAKKHAAESKTSNQREAENQDEPQTALATQHTLKKDAFEQSIKQVQKKLSTPNRAFSKVVHNKTVDTISNVGAATVARPSGLLGGSICAFLGSAVLLYTSKHYGFRYNYFVLIVLFIGGFAVGGLLELLVWAIYKRKRHY